MPPLRFGHTPCTRAPERQTQSLASRDHVVASGVESRDREGDYVPARLLARDPKRLQGTIEAVVPLGTVEHASW